MIEIVTILDVDLCKSVTSAKISILFFSLKVEEVESFRVSEFKGSKV
jgi:hypothetical protein